MSKTKPAFEKAREEVVKSRPNVAGTVNDDGPRPVAKIGERVRITKGELVDEGCVATVARLDGQEGRVDGNCYVAVGGPSKGKLVQPLKLDDGTLVGVPTDKLASISASGHSRPAVGWTPSYEAAYDRIFGKKKHRR